MKPTEIGIRKEALQGSTPSERHTVHDENMLTPKEASRFLKISLVSIWRLRLRGDLPSHLFGTSVRFYKPDLLEYGRRKAEESLENKKKGRGKDSEDR